MLPIYPDHDTSIRTDFCSILSRLTVLSLANLYSKPTRGIADIQLDYHAFVHENVACTTYNLCCHFIQDYSLLSRNQLQNLVFLHVKYF